jgi:hypothetical protein
MARSLVHFVCLTAPTLMPVSGIPLSQLRFPPIVFRLSLDYNRHIAFPKRNVTNVTGLQDYQISIHWLFCFGMAITVPKLFGVPISKPVSGEKHKEEGGMTRMGLERRTRKALIRHVLEFESLQGLSAMAGMAAQSRKEEVNHDDSAYC